MVNTLIIGAGAIGRGFLPWCLPSDARITFVDRSQTLVDQLGKAGSYTSFLSRDGKLEALNIRPFDVLHVSECQKSDFSKMDAAFIAVGPRNVEGIPLSLGGLNCPVFSLENDPATVFRLRELLKNEKIYFGVPDVITSSTASPENLAIDPLSLHTEDGVLYLADTPDAAFPGRAGLKAVWSDSSRLSVEWDAKLYIHNTPHCIAAYLGHLGGWTYMHEAMRIPQVRETVLGVIQEVLLALKNSKKYAFDFLESYADKELYRFQDTLLFDPITRVARHPLRKLRPAPHGRLIGALDLCLLAGVYPYHLLTGIAAALHYDQKTDDDFQSLSLIEDYGIAAFLWHFLAIPPDSLISNLVSRAYGNFDTERFR